MFIVALLGMFISGLMISWHPEPEAFIALAIIIASVLLSFIAKRK